MDLTPEELRVLGSLVEKELTTPQQYPLTLNALVLACNQTSNRDPVSGYDERTVEEAVTQAKTRGLVRFVHPSHGRSALRYRHELREQWGLDERQVALVAVLALRGPQTVAELRTRTERMAPIGGPADVEAELAALAGRGEPLVVRVPRGPGQKEDRFAHLLAGEVLYAEPSSDSKALVAPVHRVAPAFDFPARVEALEDEVRALRRDLDDLRAQLGA